MNKPRKFSEIDDAPQTNLISEFWFFLRHNKKFWMAPIILLLLLFGALIILGGSSVAPFIYTLF